MKFASLTGWLMVVAMVAGSVAVAACSDSSSSSDDPSTGATGGGVATGGGDTGGAAGAATTGGTGGTATTGGTGGTATTGGTGGGSVVTGACSAKVVVTETSMIDFDDYDGATAIADWSTSFNGDADGIGAVYLGPFAYDDETGTPVFEMVTGNASTYAVGISNVEASAWGAGLGLWMGCIDASAYSGISFWVRGSTGPGVASLTLGMAETTEPDTADAAAGGTCLGTDPDAECNGPTVEFNVTDTWTQITLDWSDFTPGTATVGVAVPASGDNLMGLNFGVPLVWQEDPASPGTWIPVPSGYELQIDDIALY